jgi:DegV family protein with EDD domain
MLDTNRIEVVDSRVTSMALGFPVLAAARAAKDGATLQECKAIAEECCANSGVVFTVKTLEYLHKGGRIGGASALLGTTLDIKPILTLVDGKIEPVEKVRTMNKALDHLVSHFKKKVDSKSSISIAIVQGMCFEEAKKLRDMASNSFSNGQVDTAFICDFSPVIGVHTGPGTIGIAYMTSN